MSRNDESDRGLPSACLLRRHLALIVSKLALHRDRAFQSAANQLQLFLHRGLLASKRWQTVLSEWGGATSATIRCMFVKLAARVEEMKTRIKLSCLAGC